jgi:ribosomal-protein-alanine N-acetyltransferase
VHWKIIEMKSEHLEQVMEIERASFPTPWTSSMFFCELTSPISFPFVAVKGEKQDNFVLSYIVFWMFKGEVQILNLATHPGFRRLGIAYSLLQFTLDFTHKKRGICYFLEVRRSNQAAFNLYERMGFTLYGIRKNYYTDTGEDALVMSLFYGDRTGEQKGDERSRLPQG